MNNIFDTHAHYSSRQYDADRAELLTALPAGGVVGVLEWATHSGDAAQVLELAHAAPYFLKFTARWPTVCDLAAEADEEVMAAWAGLGYYARARNLLACARAVARDHGGVFPDTEEGLRSLPGLGPYTAAAVGASASDSA